MAESKIQGATQHSVTTSSFITVNTGFAVSDVLFVQQGNLLMGKFLVSRNAQTEAGETIIVGTLKSAYIPRTIGGVIGATYRGLIAMDGRIFLRPYATVNANSNENVVFMLAL